MPIGDIGDCDLAELQTLGYCGTPNNTKIKLPPRVWKEQFTEFYSSVYYFNQAGRQEGREWATAGRIVQSPTNSNAKRFSNQITVPAYHQRTTLLNCICCYLPHLPTVAPLRPSYNSNSKHHQVHIVYYDTSSYGYMYQYWGRLTCGKEQPFICF